jgi:hypothetical protein
MRESSDGRNTMPPWRVAQRVYGAIDGCPGTVVSVDPERETFTVQWADENAVGDVVYPYDTIMVRGAFPWE